MAEFQEVMRQLNRLCKTVECGLTCPMEAMGCCGNIGNHCSEPLQAERIERTVMQWAAEHPKPVYPTWIKWLGEQGILNVTMLPTDTGGGLEIYGEITGRAYEHIPADIAQKLGIEPKEG